MFSGLEQPTHILIILVVAFLVFGAKRLPEMARSLGTGIREFKDSINGDGAPTTVEQDGAPAQGREDPS